VIIDVSVELFCSFSSVVDCTGSVNTMLSSKICRECNICI